MKKRNCLNWFFCLLVLTACSSKEKGELKPTVRDSAEVAVKQVIGIGKVEPLSGIVELASEVSGIVSEIKKMDGDSVRKGEVILILNNENERLKVKQIENQVKAAEQTIFANKNTVQESETQLRHKIEQLQSAKKIAAVGGETAENIAQMETDKSVLESQLERNKAVVAESQSNRNELMTQLSIAKQDLENRVLKAPADGVMLNMNIHIGEALNALTSYATFAPIEPMVVHGEADEMFANRLKIGQRVKIHLLGNAEQVTTGKITTISVGLSNKSLFSDEPGEQQDRRVRRFKVLLDSTNRLLINTKVSCDILIQ